MATRIHMQDQVKNRIDAFMNPGRERRLQVYTENFVTFLVALLFLILGLNW